MIIGVHQAEAGADVAFLDAPVSGGEQGAVAGTLSIMVGGERAAFARAEPLFAALGRQVTWMGGPGNGQMTKLVNQVIGAATLAAVAEGVLLAARAGLDPSAVVQAVGSGAAASWMLREQAPRMQRRDFAPGFMVPGVTHESPYLPPFSRIPDYEYKYGAIFAKADALRG